METQPKEITPTELKIIEFLLKQKNYESRPQEIAKHLKINSTAVSRRLKELKRFDQQGVRFIISERRYLPEEKVRIMNTAKFYKIFNIKLARELLERAIFYSMLS